MYWVYIALAIIVIILFIVIITRLTILIDYRHTQDDDFLKVKFSIWFGLLHFNYTVPMMKLDKEPDSPGIITKKETKIGKREKPVQKKKSKLTAEELINQFKNFSELLEHVIKFHKIIRKFLKKVAILKFDWHSGIGTGNAAHTGVLVGVGWSFLGSLLGIMSSYLKLKCTPNFSIQPYFQELASDTHLKCMIRFRIGNAMVAGIRLMKNWKGSLSHFPSPLKKHTKES